METSKRYNSVPFKLPQRPPYIPAGLLKVDFRHRVNTVFFGCGKEEAM